MRIQPKSIPEKAARQEAQNTLDKALKATSTENITVRENSNTVARTLRTADRADAVSPEATRPFVNRYTDCTDRKLPAELQATP